MTDANGIRVWIDGSFIKSKNEPNNIDGYWQYDADFDADNLDPVFIDIYGLRSAVKAKYGVDFLISDLLISDLTNYSSSGVAGLFQSTDGTPNLNDSSYVVLQLISGDKGKSRIQYLSIKKR